MDKKNFDDLIKKLEEFEDAHYKVINKEKVKLFDEVLYKLLQEYVMFTEDKLEVFKSETEIHVSIKSKESLLLGCIEDKSLLAVASLADASFLETEDDYLCLRLYFNLEEYIEK